MANENGEFVSPNESSEEKFRKKRLDEARQEVLDFLAPPTDNSPENQARLATRLKVVEDDIALKLAYAEEVRTGNYNDHMSSSDIAVKRVKVGYKDYVSEMMRFGRVGGGPLEAELSCRYIGRDNGYEIYTEYGKELTALKNQAVEKRNHQLQTPPKQ